MACILKGIFDEAPDAHWFFAPRSSNAPSQIRDPQQRADPGRNSTGNENCWKDRLAAPGEARASTASALTASGRQWIFWSVFKTQ